MRRGGGAGGREKWPDGCLRALQVTPLTSVLGCSVQLLADCVRVCVLTGRHLRYVRQGRFA